MNPTDERFQSLVEQHQRLRRAAEAVVETTDYPVVDDEDARVRRSQLRTLERELRGEPQPNGLSWMSVS